MATTHPVSTPTGAAQCPVDHSKYPHQKTDLHPDASTTPIERDAEGVWHVRGFDEARAILRGSDTQQAGFNARQITGVKALINLPILYQEGKSHLNQRRQTARFFTPKKVADDYTAFIEKLADKLVADLRQKRREDLDRMSLTMATAVVSRVVGLSDDTTSGMDKRIEAFFKQSVAKTTSKLTLRLRGLTNQWRLLKFYLFDVRPAIKAHKLQAQEDLISHLLENKYSHLEILTECITYAAAGMTTTREFIGVSAWHLLENPALRDRYLVAGEEERYAILHEMLRIEPVIAHLFRRATEDITVETDGKTVTIPQGALINLHIYSTNADEEVVGDAPRDLCPARPLHGDHIPQMLMSFGDGHHRCPGAYLAIKETDIFLQRLLAIPSLRVEKQPTLGWNEVAQSYEIRDFILSVD
jgi:cytochrome P450